MHTPRNIQSPYVAADFWTQWGSINPRMCTCVKVTPRTEYGGSSAALGFTSNTRNMTLPGHAITFYATPGLAPSAIEMSLDEPISMEMSGTYQSGHFLQTDVIAGKWNFAEVEVFNVCWDNVNLGELLLVKGNLGKIQDRQQSFSAEVRGLISRLSLDVFSETSRLCRAPYFGDPVFCRKDMTGNITVDSVVYKLRQTSLQAFLYLTGELQIKTFAWSGNIPYDGYYTNGRVVGTSGANNNVVREIAYSIYNDLGNPLLNYMALYLKRAFPFTVTLGDTFTIDKGCAMTIEACMENENIINRRAEDFIPGLEAINRIPPS